MRLTWLIGLLRHRGPRLVATAAGVAIAVALLGTLAAFLAASTATMTDRATRAIAVDWQVQVAPGGSPAQVLDAVRTAPGTTAAVPVDFGQTSGFVAVTRATGTRPPRRRRPLGRASFSACPRTTAHCSLTPSGSWPVEAGCCWPNRPPRTCTPRRAT